MIKSFESDKKKTVEISRIQLQFSKLYDFSLTDGGVLRLRYEGDGRWTNPVTGEELAQLPDHTDFNHVG
ncbi:hypothetical protein RJO15_26340 [Herbaspirillum huttiense F1]|uniref:hypothetical protein n=1 Tax=Herbaspirillum huttiense TaxID=863372 RepID=UPI0028853BFF|nr:hypothetical protein [Herbaspirillum huttiense]MDT0359331.1 hypothetical protein [Herbaspirillum huttiense F1]